MTERRFKLLDCFCGLGGTSEGFLAEGFTVHGIEINPEIAKICFDTLNVKYPNKITVEVADMITLKGENFRGYDVVWGSPPCRDFTHIGRIYGKTWKNPPNPQKGLELVSCFLKFAKDAKPSFWVMENVMLLTKYLELKPMFISYITVGKNGQGKKHAFWGNVPAFLLPKDGMKKIGYHIYGPQGQRWLKPVVKTKLASWENSKIPLACGRAFARVCREKLLETGV